MSRNCDCCGKGAMAGNLVSHSKRRTRTKQFPNLNVTTIIVDGIKKTLKLCTRCIKTLAKNPKKVVSSKKK